MSTSCNSRKGFIGLILFGLNVLILGLMVRLPGIYFFSWDYIVFLKPWYYSIVDDGFAVFQGNFSDYNVSYLYFLFLATISFPDLSPLLVIKSISIIFDFVLAFFVYKCVSLKYSRAKTIPCLAALVTILAPSVILNSAWWGQCDSIHTALTVACLYALLKGRQAWAFIAFGLSFSFKLQAAFFAPLFLWLFMKKQLKWQYSLLSLLVYLALLLPAWLVGRPLGELVLIYFQQSSQYRSLTYRAQNIYQWIPYHYNNWYLLGIAFTILVVLIVALFVYKSGVKVTNDLIVQLATFSVLIVPFLLPRMRERYFFLAESIAIIFAFYFPKYWSVPVIMGLVSSLIYSLYFFGTEPVPLPLLAIFTLILIAVLGWKLLRTLGHLGPSRKHSGAAHAAGSARPG